MNAIVFSTALGSRIAILMLSSPEGPERDAVFTGALQEPDTFDSPESRAIFPGRKAEYRCRYDATDGGVTVTFQNREGWRFTVALNADDDGEWRADKDGETLSGQAFGL